jgi:hypothetical protein
LQDDFCGWEIALRDGLTDATRSALMRRLDSVLEGWNPPRYATLFYTFVVPAMFWVPEKLIDFVKWLGLSTETVAISPGALLVLGQFAISYLLTVPVTAFMAKRGLFLGADRIWFPGWQDGDGAYQKEREIFGSVELRVREAPIDLWVFRHLKLWIKQSRGGNHGRHNPHRKSASIKFVCKKHCKSSSLLFLSSVSLLPPSAERDWVGPKFNGLTRLIALPYATRLLSI